MPRIRADTWHTGLSFPIMKNHHYQIRLQWTGNTGSGTSGYSAYSRDHMIAAGNKPIITGSSDPSFRGDASRYNPEELLVASLSACHMLWFLHLCAEAKVVVTRYEDQATGFMVENEAGGHFQQVVLKPMVTVKDKSMVTAAGALHPKASSLCFIANSVNFPILHEPVILVEQGS